METEMRYSSLVCANVDVSNCTIEETDLCANSLLKFTSNGIDTLFCLNGKGQVTGAITEGDIRRAILKRKDIYVCSSADVMNREFRYICETDGYCEFWTSDAASLPIVDKDKKIKAITNLPKLFRYSHSEKNAPTALILAGGKGERMGSLTQRTPKPLLKVGDFTLLENVLVNLYSLGVRDFFISVGYLAGQIDAFLKSNPIAPGIKYQLIEDGDLPRGTAWALQKVTELTDKKQIYVSNADVYLSHETQSNFFEFPEYEISSSVVMTKSVANRIDFGVVETNSSGLIANIIEKPTDIHDVAIGIYRFQTEKLSSFFSENFFDYLDMPQLLNKYLCWGGELYPFPIRNCHWYDVGNSQTLAMLNNSV